MVFRSLQFDSGAPRTAAAAVSEGWDQVGQNSHPPDADIDRDVDRIETRGRLPLLLRFALQRAGRVLIADEMVGTNRDRLI